MTFEAILIILFFVMFGVVGACLYFGGDDDV